jgi:sarcosine oxidase subunit beta
LEVENPFMTDFAIVGGGIYGCGTAWELARRGAEVLLLEAKTIASGASGGPGSRGVRANGRDRRELPLMRLAYALWPALHQAIDADTGYSQTGHLMLIERETDYRAAPARLWLQNRQGIPTRLIEGAELREKEPHLSHRVRAALYCPHDGVADHTATTRGLAQAARRLGAEIREGTPVSGMERQGERVTAVFTAHGERFPVKHSLLLLANHDVPRLAQAELGLTLPVWWRLPQVIFTDAVDPVPPRHLIGHAHRKLALKRGPGGGVMVSGGWHGRWNRETQRAETQPDQIAGNMAAAVAVYPELEGVAVREAVADRLETQSIDAIPIIDQLPGVANMIVATGWSGHGWAIAPAVNQLLADWAYNGERPELLRPFRYERFPIALL